MSFANIAQAFAQGFSAKEVIKWLTANNKKIGGSIKEALKQGYTEDQIGEYLSQQSRGVPYGQRQSLLQGMSAKEQGDIAQRQKPKAGKFIENALETGGKAALGAGMAYATGRIAPQALGMIAKHVPQLAPFLGQMGGNNPPGAPAGAPPVGITSQTPIAGGPSPQIPQQAGASQQPPQIPQQAPIPTAIPPQVSAGLLDQMGMTERLDTMISAGNDPASIAKAMSIMMTPGQQKWLAQQVKEGKAKPIEEMIADYASLKPAQQAEQPQQSLPQAESLQAQQKEPLLKPQIEEEPEKPISKGSFAASGDGEMGKVKEIRGDKALIEVDGKIKQVKADELISSPIPEKQLGDLYEDLVNRIPESERSAMINVAGYDPNYNELIFMPHDGALYVYKDIPEEFAKLLQGAMFNAKTTGKNFYGSWAEGEASRGAGLSVLIKDLQKLYGGKGKEYVRKYEKIYDLMALPKAEIKEKEKREREARKAAKKR